ncbi:MAG: hypothetical protein RL662_1862 [Bacteroidota bacterium]|jgi:hypothetical protein
MKYTIKELKEFDEKQKIIADMYQSVKASFFAEVGIWCVLIAILPFIFMLIYIFK